MSDGYISPAEIDRRMGVDYDQPVTPQQIASRPRGISPAELDRRTGVSYTPTAPRMPTDPAIPGILNPFVSPNGRTILRAPLATNPYMGGPGPGASIAELEAYIRNNYGYMAGFLNIPEVRDVLLNAARNQWGAGELYGAITKTNWWKNTSASARQWTQLLSEDPAEARRMVQEYASRIGDAAKTYGLTLSGAQIAELATNSARFGWTAEEEVDNILRNVNWSTLGGGTLTSLRDRMKQLGAQFIVKVSDDTAQRFALRIASGELTEEGVVSIFQSQAKARFGYLSNQIDAGVTPMDYFMPARDMIAATLEVNPDEISLLEDRWLGLLEKRDQQGNLVPATLNDAMLAARRQPEWMNTKNATEMMANFGTQLSQAFGRN